MTIDLPSGFRIRTGELADISNLAVVGQAADLADIGEPDVDEDWLHDEWTRPRFDPSTDAWIVDEPGGSIVAFAYTWDEEPHLRYDSTGYVLPHVRGRGIGSALVASVERRALRDHAQVPPGSAIHVMHSFESDVSGLRDPAASGAQAFFEAHGYTAEREYLHMGIDVPRDFEAWPAPPGITIRPRLEADDRGIVAVMGDAFDDPWDYDEAREEFERSRHHDPSLWIVALEGEQHVGALFGYVTNGRGQVSALGVRAPWRGRGIGEALLRAVFVRFRDRDVDDVRLNVDRDNPSGATRLYERAGMRPRRRWLVVSKTLVG